MENLMTLVLLGFYLNFIWAPFPTFSFFAHDNNALLVKRANEKGINVSNTHDNSTTTNMKSGNASVTDNDKGRSSNDNGNSTDSSSDSEDDNENSKTGKTGLSGQPVRLRLLKPVITQDVTPQFAIGDIVEFEWEYDSEFKRSPKYLQISFSVPTSSGLKYSDIGNLSGDATKFDWDTSAYSDNATVPLIESSLYNLIIYDDRGKDASVRAGALTTFRAKFAMYRKGSSGFCATCLNGASVLPYVSTAVWFAVTVMLVSLMWI